MLSADCCTQIMSLLQAYDVKWPNNTKQVLAWSKIVNIGVGITAPDCVDYNFNFLLLYMITMVSPVRAICRCFGKLVQSGMLGCIACRKQCIHCSKGLTGMRFCSQSPCCALQIILVILCVVIWGSAALLRFIRLRQLDQPQASLEHEEKLNISVAKAEALQNRLAQTLCLHSCPCKPAEGRPAKCAYAYQAGERVLACRCFKNAFWIVSLLYPNISQTALQLFLKQKLDIGTYLRTDYQILTRDANGVVDPTYEQYVVPGILVIIFFAIGLPVMFFCVLWSVRKRLEASRRPARYSGGYECVPMPI